MTIRYWLVLAVAALMPVLLGFWLVQGRPVARPTAAPVAVAAAPVEPVAEGTAGAAAARRVHAQLLNDAANMAEPSVMPVPNARQAGAPQSAAQADPAALLPPAPEKMQVAIAFTGNVVGELDPCG